MKKILAFLTLIIMTVMFCFAQTADTAAVEGTSSFWSTIDWGTIVNVGLGIFAVVFVGAFTIAKNKLKQLGELAIALANAIEDKKIDANEKIDLAAKVKALLGKTS